MTARFFFSLGKLEGLQDLVAGCNRVGKALQSGRKLLKFVPAEVTVTRAGGQNQIVISDRHVLPVGVTDDDALLIFVHSCNLAQDHRGVLLVSENPPDWKANLIGGQNRRGHLIEQGLKQVVIRAVDQDDFCRRLLESLGDGQSRKATADYDDFRPSHLLQFPSVVSVHSAQGYSATGLPPGSR